MARRRSRIVLPVLVLPVLVLLLLGLGPGLAFAGAPVVRLSPEVTAARASSDVTVVALHYLDELASPLHEGTARVLSVVEMSCEKRVERQLVAGPRGERLMLTEIHDPTSGLKVLEIVDDASGWWARLTDRSTLTWPIERPGDHGSQHWFFSWRERPHPVTRTIEVEGDGARPGRFVLEGSTWEDDLDGRVRNRFQTSDAGRALRDAPASADRGLALLAELAAGGGSRFLAFHPLLEALVDEELGDGRSTWDRTTGFVGGRGTDLVDPETVELATRFVHLEDPEDPLAGLHAPADGGCSAE